KIQADPKKRVDQANRLLYAGKLLVLNPEDPVAQNAIGQFRREANTIHKNLGNSAQVINQGHGADVNNYEDIGGAFSVQSDDLEDLKSYIHRLRQIRPLLNLIEYSSPHESVDDIKAMLTGADAWYEDVQRQIDQLEEFKRFVDEFG